VSVRTLFSLRGLCTPSGIASTACRTACTCGAGGRLLQSRYKWLSISHKPTGLGVGADQAQARCHGLLSHALALAHELLELCNRVIQQRRLGAPGPQASAGATSAVASAAERAAKLSRPHRSSALVVAFSALLFSPLFASAFCTAFCM